MQDPCFVEEAQLIDVREPEEVYVDVDVFFSILSNWYFKIIFLLFGLFKFPVPIPKCPYCH